MHHPPAPSGGRGLRRPRRRDRRGDRRRWRHRGGRANPPAGPPAAARSCGPAPCVPTRDARAGRGGSEPSRSSSSRGGGHRRQRPPDVRSDRVPLQVPAGVLAELPAAVRLAEPLHEQPGVLGEHRRRRRPGRWGWHRLARRTRATGRGTATGRPRQPRPTTTPSQPGLGHHPRRRRPPSNTSPLPSTGIERTCSLSAAMAAQSDGPA